MTQPLPARHIVLIHGAWQGSWAFSAWSPLLQARGWQVHAVDLPGNSWPPAPDGRADLASYTAHVASIVEAIGQRVIVLGHSGGGLTASQVAETMAGRVAGLVYLAGMMLPSGLSYAALVDDMARAHPDLDLGGISPWLQWSEDRRTTSVRTEGALAHFLHDCDPVAAKAAAALLRPQPETGRDMVNHLTPERFGRVPRIYVECENDQSVYAVIQRRMQALTPGADVVRMDCGHVPQLARPEELTERLLPKLDLLLRPD